MSIIVVLRPHASSPDILAPGVLDNATRANESPLSNGSLWTTTGTVPNITSNKIVFPGNGGGTARTTTQYGAGQFLSVTLDGWSATSGFSVALTDGLPFTDALIASFNGSTGGVQNYDAGFSDTFSLPTFAAGDKIGVRLESNGDAKVAMVRDGDSHVLYQFATGMGGNPYYGLLAESGDNGAPNVVLREVGGGTLSTEFSYQYSLIL